MASKPSDSAPAAYLSHGDNHPDERFPISGYNTRDGHFLDLSVMAPEYKFCTRALGVLQHVRNDYADKAVEYEQAFNWDTVIDKLRSITSKEKDYHFPGVKLFVVAFYSSLLADLPKDTAELLGELDEDAFIEGATSGTLLKYWYGESDAERRNLATCLWVSEAEAKKLMKYKLHQEAVKAGAPLYEYFTIKTYQLVIEEGVTSYSFESLN
jgi:hypothetical protein